MLTGARPLADAFIVGAQRVGLRFVEGGRALTLWNPRSGTHQLLRERVEAGERVFLALEAAETLILTLGLAE